MTAVNSVKPINQEKVKKNKNIKESVAACAGGNVAAIAMTVPSLIATKAMSRTFDLPQDQVNLIKKGLYDAIVEVGLDKKGVKLNYVPEENIKVNILKDIFAPSLPEQVKQGRNASFNFLTNEIQIPEHKLSGVGFHEIGHSMNRNFSKAGRILQYARLPVMVLACIPLFVGAFSRSHKEENEVKLSRKQKTINFIRKNAGKLAFLAMTPVLAEELMATLKGQKLAKKLLSPELFQKVLKGNKFGFLSYLGASVATGIGAWSAVEIKDYLVAKKEAKKVN